MTVEPTPPRRFSRMKIILAATVVVVVALLGVIAWSVTSQAIRASDKAAADQKASDQASEMAKVLDQVQATADAQLAALAIEANGECERKLVEVFPTKTVVSTYTKSAFDQDAHAWRTTGGYTDPGGTLAMQFSCISHRHDDGSWSVVLQKPSAL